MGIPLSTLVFVLQLASRVGMRLLLVRILCYPPSPV